MTDPSDVSRIPAFYKRSVSDRLRILRDRELLREDDYLTLLHGRQVLQSGGADRMVENVIGVFSLPLGLALNFRINGKPFVVPMAVEEPSIVAALSSAAKTVAAAGGFESESTDPVLIGQVQVVEVDNVAAARAAVLQARQEILNLANSLHPRMTARGGGALDVEVVVHAGTAEGDMVVVHLLVDTRDAMGANLVNSMCEGVAPLIEKLTGGKVFLRILSNLSDRAMVRTRVVVPVKLLDGNGYAGEDVRDGIVLANEFAAVDPYRAATHNKGIMNGVDAVALATGNDWRALEAAAHAYAGRGSHYTALTRWTRGEAGDLIGELEMPLKVGTVGAPLQSNPAASLNLRLLGAKSARELAEVMGAVGLAQNFAALRALVTDGIQLGHMTLHARGVALAAGATPEIFNTVVEELVATGEIKVWKAEEIVAKLLNQGMNGVAALGDQRDVGAGFGKVILLGEHAVVYGSHGIAAPIPLAVRAKVEDAKEGVKILIPAWGVEERIQTSTKQRDLLQESISLILRELKLLERGMSIKLFPSIPRAMGMGGSAAAAVAVVRALAKHFGLAIDDAEVSRLAYESEKIAHGTPSGIDNTLATYGRFILFKKGEPPMIREMKVPKPIPIVLGVTGVESLTAKTVARVRENWQRTPQLYDRIFAEIDSLVLQAVEAIEKHDLTQLGDLMNINQGLLNALQVSSPELEALIQIARNNGALGAKLTGGGGGGSIVAICPDSGDRVAEAMKKAGFHAIQTQIG